MVPPAYPTWVRITPGRLPNRESGPQNQPSAKVAVSVFSGAARSMSGRPGVVPFPFLGSSTAAQATNPTRQAPTSAIRQTGPTPFNKAVTSHSPFPQPAASQGASVPHAGRIHKTSRYCFFFSAVRDIGILAQPVSFPLTVFVTSLDLQYNVDIRCSWFVIE